MSCGGFMMICQVAAKRFEGRLWPLWRSSDESVKGNAKCIRGGAGDLLSCSPPRVGHSFLASLSLERLVEQGERSL
jgi:hypothetical protein